MSDRNRYRAAVKCRALTGQPFTRCKALEQQRLISLDRPVPDPGNPDQASFEALIVSTLADALTERQLGAAFGVIEAAPIDDHLALRLHPMMARRVLWEMLPRYDSDYGGILGAGGMRVDFSNQKITLYDLLSEAHLVINQPLGPHDIMHMRRPSEQPLWLTHSATPHGSELRDREYWASGDAGRNWLLSRMLRRPGLVNKTCAKHGRANTYTHAQIDLVIEWCCDNEPSDLAWQLIKSGITDPPDDPFLAGPSRSSTGRPRRLVLGDTEVVLRRGYCSGNPPDAAERLAHRRAWYR